MAKASRPKNQEKDAVVATDEAVEIARATEQPVEPVTMEEPTKDAPSDEVDDAEVIEAAPSTEPQYSVTQSASTETTAPKIEEKEDRASPGSESRGSNGGFVGMVVGGIVAAAMGYGVATYFPLASESNVSDDLEALKKTIASQAVSIKSLEEAAGQASAFEQRLTAVEAAKPVEQQPVDLGPIEATLAALEERLATLETLPVGNAGEGNTSDPTVAAALAAMKAEIEDLKGQGDAAAASVAAAAAEAEARLAEAEAQAEALKAEAEAAAQNALVKSALGRIAAALESGAPFDAAFADLGGITIPDPLASVASTGVPTVASLAEAFPTVARSALDASRRATMGESLTDRLSSFLETATGARSLTPREGTDPDAILSRAEAAVGSGELTAALSELGSLPPEGQAEMTQWVALAQLRLDALAAFDALSASIPE